MTTTTETQPSETSASQSAPTAPAETTQRATSARRTTPALTHVEPRPLLDPIRQVKRHSIHWKRKVFHVLGVGTAALTYVLTTVTQSTALMILGGIAAVFVTLDLLRFKVPALNKIVKRDFGPYMRDYELDGISGSS
ncbi:MAG TPA: hypothetical protein DEA08_07910, partial [Planctomycetes bacterium]|nr:hypothetical protein [Planctomycetota bacterium]